MLSFGLRRGDVVFDYFAVRPGTAQIEKLLSEQSNHLDFGRKAAAFKYPLMAVIDVLFFIVVTAIGIEFAFM